jgi:hypothetical protein
MNSNDIPTPEVEQAGKDIVKRKRGSQSASIVANNTATPDDISRMLSDCYNWYKIGEQRVKTDAECADRLDQFFQHCIAHNEIPTVEKMCLALGYDRKEIWKWQETESMGAVRSHMIKKAKGILHSLDGQMAVEGKINALVYFFRQKNYFGMTDQQEIIFTPNNPLGNLENPDEISKRIEAGMPEIDV